MRSVRAARLIPEPPVPHRIVAHFSCGHLRRCNMEIISRSDATERGVKTYHGKPCTKGHTLRYLSTYQCVTCTVQAALDYRRARPGYAARAIRRHEEKYLSKFIYQRARRQAKIMGREFTLDLGDVVIPTECPCCGVVIDKSRTNGRGKRTYHRDRPSLDRIDSRLGYTKGNVAIICWGCNRRKGDSTIRQLERLLAWMKQASDYGVGAAGT